MSWRPRRVNRCAQRERGGVTLFRRRKPEDDFAIAVYNRTAEQARAAELFEACGIPDTLDGRFDALALHAALVIDYDFKA